MVGTRLLLRCLPDTTGRRSTMTWLTGYVNFIVMHYDDQTYHIHNNPVIIGKTLRGMSTYQKEILSSCTCPSSIPVSNTWNMVGIDLITLAPTKNGNQYCITLTDYFSKWVEAAPMPFSWESDEANQDVPLFARGTFSQNHSPWSS